MCGIVGFSWEDEAALRDMSAVVANRGPDSTGEFIEDGVSLGHRRLSIIDLSAAGHQPMYSQSGDLVLVYNGEIYNFQSLKDELRNDGYEFDSDTDSEVLLYAYDRWGDSFVEKLNGMYSFAIFDRDENRLYLARDHAGIKPLYYHRTDRGIAFASTIPALLELNCVNPEPNPSVVRDFLQYGLTDHTDETFFTGIKSLPKGNYAVFDLETNDFTTEEFWDFSFSGDFDGSYEEAVAGVRERLERSVSRRLMSDVPVGACLSGGIDSSSIVSIVGQSADIDTYSVVFPGKECDESEYVDAVVDEIGVQNSRITPEGADLAADLESLAETIGEPPAGPSIFLQHKVFELASGADTKVLLDGQGSDEQLAGYHMSWGVYFSQLLFSGGFGRLLENVKRLAEHGEQKGPLLRAAVESLPNRIREPLSNRQSIVSDSLMAETESAIAAMEKSIGSLHDALEYQVNNRLEMLLKYEDRNSMHFSLEARTPFLDPELMEFISRLPPEYLLAEGRTKHVLRDAMDGIVPDEVLARRDKIGFSSPKRDWIKSDQMRSKLHEWFVDSKPVCSDYVELSKVRTAIEKLDTDDDAPVTNLWRCVFLESWLRAFESELTIPAA